MEILKNNKLLLTKNKITMKDLKDDIIRLQGELIKCLRQMNYLENDIRRIESAKNNTVLRLKDEIEVLKARNLRYELQKLMEDSNSSNNDDCETESHKCKYDGHPCDDAATYARNRPVNDYTLSKEINYKAV